MDTRNENTKQLIQMLNNVHSVKEDIKAAKAWANAALKLIQNGADINATNTFHQTFLLALTQLPIPEFLAHYFDEIINEHGADIFAQDIFGQTPLRCYLDKKNFDQCVLTAMRFLSYGADPNTKNANGDSFLHLLTRFYNSNNITYYKNQIYRLIATYHANTECLNSNGLTPLQWLISQANFSIPAAMHLAELGADINKKNTHGMTLIEILSDPRNNINGKYNSHIKRLQEIEKRNKEQQETNQTHFLNLQENKIDEFVINGSHDEMSAHYCNQAMQFVQQNLSLRVLKISDVYLNCEQLNSLIYYVNHFQISDLTFVNHYISRSNQIKIAELLSNNNLIKFEFSLRNKISTECVKAIADAIKTNQHLQELKLSAADFSTQHAEIISEALPDNPTLKILDLTGNSLGAKGIVTLMMKRNPHLTIKCTDQRLYSNENCTITLTTSRNNLEVEKKIQITLLDKKKAQRFQEEISIMQELTQKNAPHIVRFHDAYEVRYDTHSSCFIYMEYMPNDTLSNAIKQNAIYLKNFYNQQSIMLKLTIGLNFIHFCGILHRDLKCSNILFDAQGNPRIADFGLSTRNPEKGFVGTVPFASPEAIRGEIQTIKADIFSLGIVFWCMVAKQKQPYWDKNKKEITQAKLQNESPVIPNSCPIKLREMLRLCWHHNPHNRPSTAEMLPDLESEVNAPLSKNMTLMLNKL